MIDIDTRAAAAFYRSVRAFAINAKPWSLSTIFHQPRPDEKWDVTLVSQRVYGRRDEVIAVLAAAGMDSVSQPVPIGRMIYLPDEQRLYAIKRETGYESMSVFRDGREPVWERS